MLQRPCLPMTQQSRGKPQLCARSTHAFKKSRCASFGHVGTAAAAGEAATEAAADTVRATLDPADGGREALHVAARKCVYRGGLGVAWGPVKGSTRLLPCPHSVHQRARHMCPPCLPTNRALRGHSK